MDIYIERGEMGERQEKNCEGGKKEEKLAESLYIHPQISLIFIDKSIHVLARPGKIAERHLSIYEMTHPCTNADLKG